MPAHSRNGGFHMVMGDLAPTGDQAYKIIEVTFSCLLNKNLTEMYSKASDSKEVFFMPEVCQFFSDHNILLKQVDKLLEKTWGCSWCRRGVLKNSEKNNKKTKEMAFLEAYECEKSCMLERIKTGPETFQRAFKLLFFELILLPQEVNLFCLYKLINSALYTSKKMRWSVNFNNAQMLCVLFSFFTMDTKNFVFKVNKQNKFVKDLLKRIPSQKKASVNELVYTAFKKDFGQIAVHHATLMVSRVNYLNDLCSRTFFKDQKMMVKLSNVAENYNLCVENFCELLKILDFANNFNNHYMSNLFSEEVYGYFIPAEFCYVGKKKLLTVSLFMENQTTFLHEILYFLVFAALNSNLFNLKKFLDFVKNNSKKEDVEQVNFFSFYKDNCKFFKNREFDFFRVGAFCSQAFEYFVYSFCEVFELYLKNKNVSNFGHFFENFCIVATESMSLYEVMNCGKTSLNSEQLNILLSAYGKKKFSFSNQNSLLDLANLLVCLIEVSTDYAEFMGNYQEILQENLARFAAEPDDCNVSNLLRSLSKMEQMQLLSGRVAGQDVFENNFVFHSAMPEHFFLYSDSEPFEIVKGKRVFTIIGNEKLSKAVQGEKAGTKFVKQFLNVILSANKLLAPFETYEEKRGITSFNRKKYLKILKKSEIIEHEIKEGYANLRHNLGVFGVLKSNQVSCFEHLGWDACYEREDFKKNTTMNKENEKEKAPQKVLAERKEEHLKSSIFSYFSLNDSNNKNNKNNVHFMSSYLNKIEEAYNVDYLKIHSVNSSDPDCKERNRLRNMLRSSSEVCRYLAFMYKFVFSLKNSRLYNDFYLIDLKKQSLFTNIYSKKNLDNETFNSMLKRVCAVLYDSNILRSSLNNPFYEAKSLLVAEIASGRFDYKDIPLHITQKSMILPNTALKFFRRMCCNSSITVDQIKKSYAVDLEKFKKTFRFLTENNNYREVIKNLYMLCLFAINRTYTANVPTSSIRCVSCKKDYVGCNKDNPTLMIDESNQDYFSCSKCLLNSNYIERDRKKVSFCQHCDSEINLAPRIISYASNRKVATDENANSCKKCEIAQKSRGNQLFKSLTAVENTSRKRAVYQDRYDDGKSRRSAFKRAASNIFGCLHPDQFD